MAKSKRVDRSIGHVAALGEILFQEGKLSSKQMMNLADALRALISAYNGHISFGNGENSTHAGNIDGHTKSVFFKDADTDYEVPYELDNGRVAVGILVLNVNQDGAIVRPASDGSWTPTRMFARCNTAGTTALFIVV